MDARDDELSPEVNTRAPAPEMRVEERVMKTYRDPRWVDFYKDPNYQPMKPGSAKHLLDYRKHRRFSEDWRKARKLYLDYVIEHVKKGVKYQEIGNTLGLSDSAIAEIAYKHVYSVGERRKVQHNTVLPKGPPKISLAPIPPPRS